MKKVIIHVSNRVSDGLVLLADTLQAELIVAGVSVTIQKTEIEDPFQLPKGKTWVSINPVEVAEDKVIVKIAVIRNGSQLGSIQSKTFGDADSDTKEAEEILEEVKSWINESAVKLVPFIPEK